MSVSVGGFTEGSLSTAGTTVSISHAAAVDDTVILVMVSTRGASSTPTSGMNGTYAGAPLTLLGSKGTASEERVDILACELPVTGTHDLVLNWTNNAVAVVGIYNFKGAKLPLASSIQSESGSSGDPSVNITSATGDIVVDAISEDRSGSTSMAVGAGQTQKYNTEVLTSGYNMLACGSREAGAASVTMSWTVTNGLPWVHIAINVPAGSPHPRGNAAAISPYFMI